jgi:hypothetical protein
VTENWHLDKRIPIATILAILGQAIALGWLASSMDGRISALEKVADAQSSMTNATHVTERIAVLESNQVHINQQLDHMDVKLDRITERLNIKVQ